MTRLIEHAARTYYRHPRVALTLFWVMVFLVYVTYVLNLAERAH